MRKLTKAEAGALGVEKSRIAMALKKEKRAQLYNLSPTYCAECNSALAYESRKKKFCNSSCSALFNNKQRKVIVDWQCGGCGNTFSTLPYQVKKFCSHKCRATKTKIESDLKISAGKIRDRTTIKKSLIRKFGHSCSNCGLSEWKGVTLSLEVDHIDGNAGNNLATNLRLLCPNCHSITSTWKGKNKGSGRAARGLPLY